MSLLLIVVVLLLEFPYSLTVAKADGKTAVMANNANITIVINRVITGNKGLWSVIFFKVNIKNHLLVSIFKSLYDYQFRK
jgi:hypothetical protein